MRRNYLADLAENLELTEKELKADIFYGIIGLPIALVIVYATFFAGYVMGGWRL